MKGSVHIRIEIQGFEPIEVCGAISHCIRSMAFRNEFVLEYIVSPHIFKHAVIRELQ
jgi:hypothetical protein